MRGSSMVCQSACRMELECFRSYLVHFRFCGFASEGTTRPFSFMIRHARWRVILWPALRRLIAVRSTPVFSSRQISNTRRTSSWNGGRVGLSGGRGTWADPVSPNSARSLRMCPGVIPSSAATTYILSPFSNRFMAYRTALAVRRFVIFLIDTEHNAPLRFA